jgi:imidazolonepropionase
LNYEDYGIYLDGRLVPLRKIVPPAYLAAVQLGIRGAELRDGWVCVTLSDGEEFARRHCAIGASAFDGKLVIRNPAQVLTCPSPRTLGVDQPEVVACSEGRIAYVGEAAGLQRSGFAFGEDCREIDASGCLLAPGLIDPHTHPVFAGERSFELGLKAAGQSYMELHRAGGGIQATVRATRQADAATLLANCRDNLDRLLSFGITTCEGKSGYALSTEGELRLLRVLNKASATHPVEIQPTLLGAHTVPAEYTHRRQEYLRLVVDEMIPRVSAERLATSCDAYCEEGAFSRAEVAQVFRAATDAGLGLRLHAGQFSDLAGVELAAEMGALSVDHLEHVSDAGVAALARSRTVAVLLPGAALMCRCPVPPARRLIDGGVLVALGTDLNPGSSMTAALPLMLSLACAQLGMTCEEAWLAVTSVAAMALGREDLGTIRVGARADLALFAVPDYRYVPYHYGENHLRCAIKDGNVVCERMPRPSLLPES